VTSIVLDLRYHFLHKYECINAVALQRKLHISTYKALFRARDIMALLDGEQIRWKRNIYI
jgi:hypothetical protein